MIMLNRFLPAKFHSLFRYLVIGGSAFLLDLGLLIALHSIFSVPVYLAATCSYIAALCYNFLLNRSWTFGAKGNLNIHIALYSVLVVINYAVTLLLLALLGKVGI